mgnify:CR=1 FL=1
MKQWFLTHRYGLTVALVAAMILLPFLGAAPLMDPDEPVYGETAREMLLAGIGMALAGTLLLFATADRKEKSRERM